jgi:hypothetical protein
MSDPNGNKPSMTVDHAGIHAKNAINVAMEDLSEEEREEIERDLKEEIA